MNALTKFASATVHHATMFLKKHGPTIATSAGIIGLVGSGIYACYQSTKLPVVKDEHEEAIYNINSIDSDPKYTSVDEVEDAKKKEVAKVYIHTGLKLVKMYAPSVAVSALSIYSIAKAHSTMKNRNAALSAAFAGITEAFKGYRGRVGEKIGEEAEKRLFYDISSERTEETVSDPETGKEKKRKVTIDVANDHTGSPYARFFDEGCAAWQKDPEANLTFLLAQQSSANDILKRRAGRGRGYMTLNEVYRMLGIPESKSGQVVGWIYDEHNQVGDNYIDFGIFNTHRSENRDFVNGYEPVIMLDFNVDGYIWDQLPEGGWSVR